MLYITETDQTDPAGRWRFRQVSDALSLQHALTASWGSYENWINFAASDDVIYVSKAIYSLPILGIGVDAQGTNTGILRVSGTITNPTTLHNIGVFGGIYYSATLAKETATAVGAKWDALADAANTQDWSGFVGISTEVDLGDYVTDSDANYTVDTVHLFAGTLRLISGVTVTDAVNIYVTNPANSGANPLGTITNNYGIYIENMTSGSTLNYSIYSAGGLNYFAGNMNLDGYLKLKVTDTDGATEGQLWYDDSENVLKYYNGTIVKTVATV